MVWGSGFAVALSAQGCGDGGASTGASSTAAASTVKPTPAPSQKPNPSAKPPTKDVPTASAAPSGSGSADTPSSGDGGGTNTTGFENPEALGKAMVAAFNDPTKLASLFPADSVLDGSFECKDKDHFHSLIRESIKEIEKDVKKEKGPFEFVKADPPPTEVKTLKKGEEGEGCVTKEAVDMSKWRLTFKAAGKEDDGGVEMMKLGGKWYPIGM